MWLSKLPVHYTGWCIVLCAPHEPWWTNTKSDRTTAARAAGALWGAEDDELDARALKALLVRNLGLSLTPHELGAIINAVSERRPPHVSRADG